MWNRLREIVRLWWPVGVFSALGGFYCWLGFHAFATGVYRWRGRSTLAAMDPVGFRDGVILSLIAGFGLLVVAGAMAWLAAAGMGSKARIDAYLAKRRKVRDETVA